MPPATLSAQLGSEHAAKAVWRAVREDRDPLAALSPALQAQLQGAVRSLNPRLTSDQSECGTVKLDLEMGDGAHIETVVIPNARRSTVCVSTQVGCARGCGFCVTATMGLRRSLGPAEVVAQVLAARRLQRRYGLPPVRNVVFMGMGEPLDNLPAVGTALEILTSPHALSFAPRHITVSTVGTSPRKILACQHLPAKLAWSIHATDDSLRRQLVPTTRHSMAAMREAFLSVMHERNDTLFVEVTLMQGVNDTPQHAVELAHFLEPFGRRVRVNVLPMNPGRSGLRASEPEAAARFQRCLREHGIFCMLRRPRGATNNAACGQLASKHAPAPGPRTGPSETPVAANRA